MTFDRGSTATLDTSSDCTSATVEEVHCPPTVTTSPPRGVRPVAAGDGTRSVRLTHSLMAVREARATLVQDLFDRGVCAAVVDEAESVVAELVGNAVRHARPLSDGCIRLRWKVKAGAVEVEVRDGGSDSTPRPVRTSRLAVHGRGLLIVRSMAHEWGVLDESNGRTVWAALGGPSRRRAG